MIYQPKEDSYLLQKSVKKYSKGKDVLDMGAGSGVQSEMAIKSLAKTTLAADVQDDVIDCLKKRKIPCIKSDLFSELKGRKFDLIAFNPPYLPQDDREDEESRITTTGGRKGDETIIRFLKRAPTHLNEGGIILLVVSSLTPQTRIKALLRKLKLEYRIIDEEKLFMEKLEVLEIKK